MSESDGRCEFEEMDYCCIPEYYWNAGYRCSHTLPVQPGDICGKCGCPDNELMTKEEWEETTKRDDDLKER